MRGLLPEDEPSYAEAGHQVRFALGGSGTIVGDELVVTQSGRRSAVRLEGLAGPARLSRLSLQLGQAGVGYLLGDGDGEYSRLRLYVPDGDGSLVRAAVGGHVPLGHGFTRDGAGYLTWTTGQGARLLTRVAEGGRGWWGRCWRCGRSERGARHCPAGADRPGHRVLRLRARHLRALLGRCETP